MIKALGKAAAMLSISAAASLLLSGPAAALLPPPPGKAPTRVTVHPNRTHFRGGRVLTLRGSVSRPVPAGGVVVLVQVAPGVPGVNYWRGFEVVRTNAAGRYVARYRMENGKESLVPEPIRTLVPQQRGYRYLANYSRVVYIYAPPGSFPP